MKCNYCKNSRDWSTFDLLKGHLLLIHNKSLEQNFNKKNRSWCLLWLS